MTSTLSDALKKYIDDEKVYATVATLGPDGHPQLKVIWLKREGDDLLYSTTATRQQAKNLAKDPRITILISPPDQPQIYAEIRGTATVTPDPDKKLPDELALKYTGQTFDKINPDAALDERVIVRLTPRKIVGQF